MAKGGRRINPGGRPRRPTAMKLITGTFRQDRHGTEPPAAVAPIAWPAPPEWLNDRERELWNDLQTHCAAWTAPGDYLVVNGVVSIVDRLLRNQATQASTNAQPVVVNRITKRGTTKDAQGNLVPTVETKVEIRESPLINQEIKLWKELRAFLSMMGLSPTDRARMHTHGSSAGDSKAPPSVIGDLIRRSTT